MTTIEHVVDEQTEGAATASASERPATAVVDAAEERSNGWQPDGLHPLRVQLRARGAARRRRTAVTSSAPRRQAPSGLAGLHVREGAAPRPLPERPRSADVAAAPRGPTARSRRSTGTPRSARSRRGFAGVRDTHGGDTIFYYGGGGQGNHLGGAYATATLRALGSALPLERARAGEDRRVLGQRQDDRRRRRAATSSTARSRSSSARTRGSRTASRAPASTLKEIARDPGALDDRHRSAPHRDRRARRLSTSRSARAPTRGCLAALVGDPRAGGPRRPRVARRARRRGSTRSSRASRAVDVAAYAARAAASTRTCSRRRPGASPRRASVAVLRGPRRADEPCTRRSCSYLQRLVWLLTGNFGKPGTHYVPTTMVALAAATCAGARRGSGRRVSPVVGARIIGGLVPCNVIAEEILTDHPNRYRAMLVESGNPAHSLADSQRMREALAALELRRRDRRRDDRDRAPRRTTCCRRSTQFEKAEATFFNFEFPRNVFHLRQPLLAPPAGHAARAGDPRPPRRGARRARRRRPRAAARGRGRGPRARSRARSSQAMADEPERSAQLRAGRPLPHARPDAARRRRVGARCSGAPRTAACSRTPTRSARAGFDGDPLDAGEALFDAILASRSPASSFAVDEWDDELARVRTPRRPHQPRHPRAARRARELARRARAGATPRSRSCSRRASAARSPRTRSSATRRGARRTRAARCACSPADAGALGVADGDVRAA